MLKDPRLPTTDAEYEEQLTFLLRVRDRLSEADDAKANAIVLGTRGLTGLKSLMLGSVSHAVVQHADRPVIIVPSPEITAKRAASRR